MTETPVADNVFRIPNSEIPDDDAPPDRNAGAICQFPGCDIPVTKPARGRSPKFCDEHRGTKSGSGAASGSSLPNWSKAPTVQAALEKYFNGLAFAIQLVNPEDGRIIASGSADVATALVNLGRQDKQWRKWLEKASAPGKYGELMLALGFGIVVPIMANHGLLPQVRIPNISTMPEGGTPA